MNKSSDKEGLRMSTYFSMGEISKMYNLSIQTLRHYDKIGLLSPAYTNVETGYRYYSMQQFVKIDFIKHGKLLGMTLDEIKELLKDDLDIPALEQLFQKQQIQVKQKIDELKEIDAHLLYLQSRLDEIKQIGLHQPTLKKQPTRQFIRYDCICCTELELEMNIRPIILDMEATYSRLNSELVFLCNPDILTNETRIQYEGILVHLINNPPSSDWKIETLEAGTYVTLFYDDHYQNNLKYFQQLLTYLNEHQLKALSPIYEFTLIPRIDQFGIEKSVVALEVLVQAQ